ncbi:MAG TPA: SLC13 family permease [Acidobacteriota bacterium]|nr:SLC13 family permease [Acidobacteriota bacterium]
MSQSKEITPNTHDTFPMWKVIVMIVFPLSVWFSPLSLSPEGRKALTIASLMIAAWGTEIFSHTLVGLIGCFLFWVCDVVEFSKAFGGFASSTPWFCYSAVLFGTALSQSGLTRHLAYWVMLQYGSTYSRLIFGFTLLSILLTFMVPSGPACVVIKAAIALGIMEATGFKPGSNVGRGIFVVLTYGASLFNKMVIAGASSIMARDMIEAQTGVKMFWSYWFLAFLPVSLISLWVCYRLTLWLFPPEKESLVESAVYLREELKKIEGWSKPKIWAAVFATLALSLWITDFWHHISPAKIGIGISLLAAIPFFGLLQSDDLKKVNYLPAFFVGTAASMGEVLVKTGATEALTTILFGWMTPLMTSPLSAVLTTFWTAFVYHLFLGSEISMLSTSMTPLLQFAQSHHLNAVAIGLIWTFAGACKVFVYQSTIVMIGYSYGYFEARDIVKFGAVIAVVESIIMVLVSLFYWPLIGLG